MARGRRHSVRERATAGVAMIGALVVLQVCVAAAAVMGARDQEVAALRLDAARAFYAAEAAANLSIREILGSTDADGDGNVGGVAARTLPSGAELSASTSGSPATVTARGTIRGAAHAVRFGVQ